MVEPLSPAPKTPESAEADHSRLLSVCEDKLAQFLDPAWPNIRRDRRYKDSDDAHARWRGFLYGEWTSEEDTARGVVIRPDEGAYPTRAGIKRGVYKILFHHDPSMILPEAFEKAIKAGGNVIDLFLKRDYPNHLLLFNDGSASISWHLYGNSGLEMPDGRKCSSRGSALSQEQSGKLAEEIEGFTQARRNWFKKPADAGRAPVPLR